MINIFILIDALGWEYIKDKPFLDGIATTKIPVKSILGFSSGVIPSILTGKYPQEHKHWSLYYYSPKTSPFRWTKALLWLPNEILNSRITRKIIEETSKRLMGYTGYFETYLIPVRQLHLFNICEKKNIYAPKGVSEVNNIFDILKNDEVNYKCLNYPLKDKEILARAKESFRKDKSSFYFIYLSEFDALLHSSCKDTVRVNLAIDSYEKEIDELYRIAKERSEQVNLYVFSDHGMAAVDRDEDLKVEIEKLSFNTPKDYVAFYDSTMARFWFFNEKAKSTIVDLLRTKSYGRILTEGEIKELGIDFKDKMYGEVIFLMNTSVVINPSYMGNKTPQGMHGFDINDGSMDAVLVSNRKIDQKIENVKDFYKIMLNATLNQGDSPRRGLSPITAKIKILYFLNSVVRGGVEEHVLGLLKNIDKDKFEPILVCPEKLIGLLQEDLEDLKVKYYAIDIRRWKNIKEIFKFIKIMRDEKPDIVNSHLFGATKFAAPLAKLSGVAKIIETAHLREGWRKGIKKAYFVDRFFYRFVDKIIAVSNAVKEYLVNEKRIAEGKIEVIHNGVDLEKFKPGDTFLLKQGDRSPKNGTSPLLIGVIGRLEPQKGHKYLLEAIKLLDGELSNVKFLIVGDGALRNELENKCRDLKIEEMVEFLGFRKDIQDIFQKIDLVILPSLYEGLPLVALEAGAMAKPIIATAVDGSREVVVDNETGLLVPPRDSFALKEAIKKCLNDVDFLRKTGESARKHIEGHFNIKNQVFKTEQLYFNTINKIK